MGCAAPEEFKYGSDRNKQQGSALKMYSFFVPTAPGFPPKECGNDRIGLSRAVSSPSFSVGDPWEAGQAAEKHIIPSFEPNN
jgi:hypothetical protein